MPIELTHTDFDVAKFASTEAHRVSIQVVRIEKDGTVCGTDGGMLLRIQGNTPKKQQPRWRKPLFLRAKDLLTLKKIIPGRIKKADLKTSPSALKARVEDNANGDVAIHFGRTGQHVYSAECTDVHFPNVESVIESSKKKGMTKVLLDPVKLLSVLQFFARHASKGVNVEIASDPLVALRFTATLDDGREALALLMPVKP